MERFKGSGVNHAGSGYKAARDVAFNTARFVLPQAEPEIANLEASTRPALEASHSHEDSVQESLDSTEVSLSAELAVMHAACSPSILPHSPDYSQFPSC